MLLKYQFDLTLIHTLYILTKKLLSIYYSLIYMYLFAFYSF